MRKPAYNVEELRTLFNTCENSSTELLRLMDVVIDDLHLYSEEEHEEIDKIIIDQTRKALGK